MPLSVILALVLALSGLVMAALAVLHRSPISERWRIREPGSGKAVPLDGFRLYGTAVFNAAFSAGVVTATCYAAYPWLFTEAPSSVWRVLVDAALVILSYDFLYYFLHRYPFHRWKWFRRVHTVHHVARFPTAVESLYLHPVETFCGVALLMFCTFLVGPVHVYTFGIAFAVYSFLNIVVHCGLSLPFFPFRAVSYMARKHAKHHLGMRAGNYASITPLWDLLFGTAE